MLQFYQSLILDENLKSRFEELYLAYRHTMLWVAQDILDDQSLAEDAVHEAFLRILNNLDKFSWEKCNKTQSYFVYIVRNIALDLYRKRKKLAEHDLDDFDEYLLDDRADPEEAWLDKEDSQHILKVLGQLNQHYVDVLTLHFSFELSSQEIAGLLGISPENVRIRLLRAKKKLARLLKEDNQNGDCAAPTT